MIISKIIGTFIFEISKEKLDKLVQENIDSKQYQLQRNVLSDSVIENKIYFIEKDLWIGDFLISSSEKERSILYIRFSLKFGELDQDEDDFCITKLRELSLHIIGNLQDKEKIIPENCEEGLDELYRAFLSEEKIEVRKKNLEKEKKNISEGIYSQVFFFEVVQTHPIYIENILNEYIASHRNHSYWNDISLELHGSSPAYIYVLKISNLLNFGYIGEVKVIQKSVTESIITISNYSDIPYFMDKEIGKSIYFKTIEELTKLSEYFSDLFSIKRRNFQPGESFDNSFQEKNHIILNNLIVTNLPGRKPNIGYDEAYEKFVKHGKSYDEALHWWEEYYPLEFNPPIKYGSELLSSPSERFKNAMNYRIRRDKKNKIRK